MGDLPDGLDPSVEPSVVTMMVMIATALAAAVLYGAGAAVEQRQAAGAPQSAAGRPRLLFPRAPPPLWVVGGAGVIVGRVWAAPPRSRPSRAAARTVAAAVAAFLLLTSPGHGHLASQPGH